MAETDEPGHAEPGVLAARLLCVYAQHTGQDLNGDLLFNPQRVVVSMLQDVMHMLAHYPAIMDVQEIIEILGDMADGVTAPPSQQTEHFSEIMVRQAELAMYFLNCLCDVHWLELSDDEKSKLQDVADLVDASFHVALPLTMLSDRFGWSWVMQLDSVQDMVRNFCQAITTGERPRLHVEDAVREFEALYKCVELEDRPAALNALQQFINRSKADDQTSELGT